MTDEKRVKNIAELAELAGVTAGTVSRALSGKGFISEKTRERIRALAEEHNFRPNVLARNLRTQRTGAISVVIPLGHERGQHISDPFFMTMLGYLADELTERGYELILSRIIPDDDDWLDNIVDSGRSDGVIIIGQSDQAETLDRVSSRYTPLVAWGGFYKGQKHCSVGSDNYLGGALAARHLVDRGCRKIAFFGDPVSVEISQRLEGCKSALFAAGLMDQPTVWPAHLAEDVNAEEIEAFFSSGRDRPDGVVAASDVIAMSTLLALTRKSIAVPEQVRIVGYDDLPIATRISPRLTTIRQDFATGAAHLIDCLFRRIGGEESASIVMKPELVEREST
ncbi:MAG TPA: LacI family transcriptional regulator [Parvularcula sp.]|nr:LacI family transcriptional regulator [Parvularcula sp.]